MSNLSITIENRLQTVRSRIAEAATRSGRKAQDITLLAVTKTFPFETLRAAYDAGLRDFGENRVQEALDKIPLLPSDIRWHFIGQLQTNKINKTLGKFVLIHSVESLRLAQALSQRVVGVPQDILLEVNTSGEASKSGVEPEAALSTAEAIGQLPNLRLRGLMTVGPLTEDVGKVRDAFKKLKGLFEDIRGKRGTGQDFSILSMGMSGDFEVAIEEGSTLVRIGSALFGSRG
jgi:pyridoxal phosphate enzyme (YggS family)